MAVIAIARWLQMPPIIGARTANGNCRPTFHCIGPAPDSLTELLNSNVIPRNRPTGEPKLGVN
jgi:hypothetical protein